MSVRSWVVTALLSAPMTLVHADEDAPMPTLPSLFAAAREATDRDYAEARARLLRRAGAEAFLQERQTEASGDEQWLAEILLARLRHAEDVARAERTLHEKVLILNLGNPVVRADGMSPPFETLVGVMLPGEEIGPRYVSAAGEEAERLREYFEHVRLPESPLWGSLAGEILLKGWAPSAALADAPPASRRSTLPIHKAGKLSGDDYRLQAVIILGKLRERRAVAPILAVLQDGEEKLTLRSAAAVALGRIAEAEAFPALEELAGSEETPPLLRNAAFEAIAEAAYPGAEEFLRRIVSRAEAEGPGSDARRWALAAKRALARIRENQARRGSEGGGRQ